MGRKRRIGGKPEKSLEKCLQKSLVACCMLAAYLSTRSISYLMNLRGGVPFSASVYTVFLWAGLSGLFVYTWQRWSREDADDQQRQKGLGHGRREEISESVQRRILFTGGLSLVYGILLVAGYQLQWLGYTEPGFRGKAKLILHGICLAAAALPFVDQTFAWAEGRCQHGTARKAAAGEKVSGKTAMSQPTAPKAGGGIGKVFWASFLGIWLLWIPVWLAYYPAIMSYDFHKQSLEALLGPKYFNNHHPLAHTWLIYVFRGLGERVGSYETGFALFSLFQQMVSAAVLGYACVMIWRLVWKKWAVIAAVLFFGCFPLVSVFVMCTTKDVLFGAFFVLFLLLVMELALFVPSENIAREGRSRLGESAVGTDGTGKRLLLEICLVLAGVLMILFRNNARYAMLPCAVFCVLLGRKGKRLRIFILAAAILLGGKGALLGLQYGFHAHKGSEIEKYSLIYQSMARVGSRQRDNLTAEEFALLDTYVTEECWMDYNPSLADTIKSPVQKINFNEKKSWDNMGSVLTAWVKLGLRYPNEYIDAFLDLTRGYWFMDDTSHAQMLGVGLEERMGLLYTYNSAAEESLPGMQHISKFPWLEEKLEQLVSANVYTAWPAVSVLFKPALWCLLPTVSMVWCWYRRNRRKALVFLYPLCYFGTMLLGPTAIIRYVYPFILLGPVVLGVVFARQNN